MNNILITSMKNARQHTVSCSHKAILFLCVSVYFLILSDIYLGQPVHTVHDVKHVNREKDVSPFYFFLWSALLTQTLPRICPQPVMCFWSLTAYQYKRLVNAIDKSK